MLGKATCETLSVCWGTALQHPSKVSRAALVTPAGISCSPTKAVQSHSREEGQCPSQKGQSRRSGQDQTQGQENPSQEETSHSSFPFSLVPGYSSGPKHGHQIPWSRVEGCSNTPDAVKTKMQLYLLGHAKYLQENLKPA